MTPFKHPRAAAAISVAAAALIGAGGGAATYAVLDAGDTTTIRQVPVESGEPAAATTSSIAEVVAESSPSVVEITVSGVGGESPFGGDGGVAQGSGFVYDEAGHVITNQHVVGDADTASVRFADGSEHDAEVVGTDPSTDLAVLKVDAPASLLEPLSLANSDELAVGDGVIAIGSPFGLEQTVTAGIVSALHREISSPNNFAIDDAIQTDAAINHGNSGGPLLDLSGRVVGVNAQIESESGGNVGVGFAVPSNTVKRIADALITDGEVEHAFLGVSLDSADEEPGAHVTDVRTGTPAEDAGLRTGDVITAAGGETVADEDDLRRLIDSRSPGDELELEVERGDETVTLDVELGTRPTS
jgi:putative serine protease PepD